jgi:hypothetical protein
VGVCFHIELNLKERISISKVAWIEDVLDDAVLRIWEWGLDSVWGLGGSWPKTPPLCHSTLWRGSEARHTDVEWEGWAVGESSVGLVFQSDKSMF